MSTLAFGKLCCQEFVLTYLHGTGERSVCSPSRDDRSAHATAPDPDRSIQSDPSLFPGHRAARGGDRRGRTLARRAATERDRSEEHTSELQSRRDIVCRILLE